MNKISSKDKKPPHLLRGMKDILPEEQKYWSWIRDRVFKFAREYGFERIEPPILEETSLFARSIGETTDIVEKEMFSFIDQSGDKISLRPEGSASVARAYIEHGMVNRPQPLKLFYWGPFFRYERPQAGRLRQFYQFGFEVIGDAHPLIDAQLIILAHNIYKELGVDFSIQINSLGHRECREQYKKALVDFYRSRRQAICDDCKRRLVKNPLRLLDCKEAKCQEIAAEAPQIVDHLCDECRQHFVSVLEYLDELDIPYVLNTKLVRGLDYYSRTVFEIWDQGESGSQAALGGGGRYDNLIGLLGSRPTPAAGFASGVERLVAKIRNINQITPAAEKPEIFIAQLGENSRKICLKLFETLRQEGIRVTESLSKNGIKPQLEVANRAGVKFAIILGQKEMIDGTILIRDMENGIQEVIDFQKLVPELKKRLSKNINNSIITK